MNTTSSQSSAATDDCDKRKPDQAELLSPAPPPPQWRVAVSLQFPGDLGKAGANASLTLTTLSGSRGAAELRARLMSFLKDLEGSSEGAMVSVQLPLEGPLREAYTGGG